MFLPHSDMQCSPLTFFQDISINVQLCPRKINKFFFSVIWYVSWTFLLVTEEIPITVSPQAPDKEAWPSPYHQCSLLLGWCYHLTIIELWSAYFDLKTYTTVHCAHSPAKPTAARQECFVLWTYFCRLQNKVRYLFKYCHLRTNFLREDNYVEKTKIRVGFFQLHDNIFLFTVFPKSRETKFFDIFRGGNYWKASKI